MSKNKMIIFRRIEHIRGLIGGAIILFSLLFLIPGLVLMVSSNTIYGAPMEGYPVIQEIPTDGSTVSVDLSMKKGFNYDIKYQLVTISQEAVSNDGSIEVFVNSSSSNGQIQNLPKGTFSDNGFNKSTLFGHDSFPNDLESDEVLTMTFQVSSSQNIDKTEIHISLYQNPNRDLATLASNVGVLLFLPGLIIFILGAVVAGSSRRDRLRKRRENRKVGEGDLFIDL